MADFEENKKNSEQHLSESDFKFPKEIKEKDIVPFDKENGVEEDDSNVQPKPLEMQGETSTEKQTNPTEDDGDKEEKDEHVNKTDLDVFQQYIENVVKSSKDDIKAYKDRLEKDVEEKIDEKLKTSTEKSIKSMRAELFDIKKELEKYKEAYNKQVFRTVEIVGVFSSVVALLVVNAGIVNSADTFLKASILIAGLSCVIIIFASLIHFFFNVDETRKPGISLIAPFCILIGLLIAGLIVEFAYDGAYKNISSSEKDNISVEAKVEQRFSDFRDHNMTVDISKNIANDSVKKTETKKKQKMQMEKSK